MVLNLQKVRDVLAAANKDSASKQKYGCRWLALATILFTSTGQRINGLARPTLMKIADAPKRDLDIIFALSPDKPRADIYSLIETKLKTMMPNVKPSITANTLHVEFTDVKGAMDYILIKQSEIDTDKSLSVIREIKQLDPVALDVIKIIKYLLDKIGILNAISVGLIEKQVFLNGTKDLIGSLDKVIPTLIQPVQAQKRSIEDMTKLLK